VNTQSIGDADLPLALQYAAGIEQGSKHPVAKAIAETGSQLAAQNVTEIAGRGVSGEVSGNKVFVEKPGSYENQAELDTALEKAGPNTLVVIAWDNRARALIELSDELRPGAKQTIAMLTEMGIESELLSGDNKARVQSLAQELKMQHFTAQASPEQKLEHVSQLRHVAMVGDGINDVAALARADVGIAMGSGAHAAQAASAVTILDDDPRAIPFAIKLGKKTYVNIWQNLGWAFGYNLLLIPVAALGFLNPMLAGAAMAFSSVSVVANSLRLRWQNSAR
jgi:Cu+-exporting ATPase